MKKQRWYSRSRSSSAPGTPTEYAVNVGCMSMVHHLIFAPGAGCVGRPPPSHTTTAAAAAANSVSGGQFNPASPSRGEAGMEAPRNSLELLHIGVQIEPAFDALLLPSGRRTAPSSAAETPRTPSLVARLMGIDGLPDQQQPSPSPGLKKKKQQEDNQSSAVTKEKRRQPLRSLSCNAVEARSLPDTPRASTSDCLVERPRLSLPVLDRAAQYVSSPTSSSCDVARKKKKIVRQAKENVKKRPTSSNKENSSPFVVEDKLVIDVQAAASSSKPTAPPPRLKARAKPPSRSAVRCERFATRIKKAAPTSRTPSTDAAPPVISSGRRRPLEDDPEYVYVRSVLERGGGFMRATTPSINPVVFHLLELELPLIPLRHRWNRKLLTQEIHPLHGAPLLAKVWSKVKSFPAADCRVVGDIDALVATDLLHATASLRGMVDPTDVADDVAQRILDDLLLTEVVG